MNNTIKYAKLLTKTHGLSQAKRIAEECLTICQRGGSNTLLFDEADFYISTERSVATYELSNTQSKKVTGTKASREQKNLNFWLEVNNILKKGVK